MKLRGSFAVYLARAAFVVLVSCLGALASNETILHSFNTFAHGQYPEGGLIADRAGNLYGTTYQGGAYGSGTVYELSPNASGGWTEAVLYSFKGIYGGGRDGFFPAGSLTLDNSGNLYGTTQGGGTKAAGTVFRLSKSNGQWVETLLWNFHPDGHPHSTLSTAFPSPCVFPTTFPPRSLTPSPPGICRPSPIALRWFSEFSEISTVFR